MILATHEMGFARELADSFLILDVGRVVAQGPIGDLSDSLIRKHLTI